jgi:hypothetical protein
MKINFLTFANELYYRNLERLEQEAVDLGIFDCIHTFKNTDLNTLFPDFYNKHVNFILNNPRGYGYWIWKSYLTLKTLEKMNENDILVYCDAGCKLNKKGLNRLYEYFDMVKNNECGNVSFQMNRSEKTWTKMDVFHFLQIKDTDIHFSSGQLIATAFILRKCDIIMTIISEWYSIMADNYRLIDDSPSKSPNDETFIENRHDQSILSLLRKKYGTITIEDETDRWIWLHERYIQFPIWRKMT